MWDCTVLFSRALQPDSYISRYMNNNNTTKSSILINYVYQQIEHTKS